MSITRREFAALGAVALGQSAITAAPKPAEWVRPRALKPGDMVAFVAPAGPAKAVEVRAAKAHVESLGYRVQLPASLAGRRDRYLAGTDDERVTELNAAIRDKSVRAVMPVRGGYGLTRIVDRVDFAALSADPKIVTGFSDITALHLAIARNCRLVTFHSPLPLYGLAKTGPGWDESNELFWRTIQGKAGSTVPLPANRPRPKTLLPGKAVGRLLGGNLSLIAATMGTPFEIEADGAILFLEDTGEAGYRVDRMLSQLRLAGVLGKIAGVILGSFDGTDDAELAAVVRDYFGASKVPVVTGYPLGHTAYNFTLAHGARAELDATTGVVRYLATPVMR